MATLNPDLLSKDQAKIMNDAVDLMREYRHTTIMPELVLLAMIRRPQTAARRLLDAFVNTRGLDLTELDHQVVRAIQSRRDRNGNLEYVAPGNKAVGLGRQTIILLDDALSVANAMHEVRIDTDHVLTVLTESSMSTSGLLRQYGITPKAIKDIVSDSSAVLPIKRSSGTTQDHVKSAARGNMRQVFFREDLLREMINILTQAVNRHIILMGPDGVGKRTLAYSLALLMAEGKGPAGLSSLVQVDEVALLDNDQQAVRAGMSKAEGGILFIPHLHRFFGGPIKAEFSKSTPIIQKTFLSDNPVIISSTTEQEYNQRLASVSAITENSQIVRVPEPSVEETIEILKILKSQVESDYDLEVTDEALELSGKLAKRYLTTEPLPRSAEYLLHRTAAMVNMSQQQHLAFRPKLKDEVLDSEDVMLTASQMTGIPVNKLGEDERARYASMVEHIKERLIGQDEAVLSVSRAIKTARVGLKDPKRPIGAFLFLGPTGVGKTELAKALAEFMFGSEDNILPLDMSEFKDESSVNRLIGSPSGYVDSEAGGQLTEAIKRQPYQIILLDEVEKAHPRIMDLLLQVFEEGRLTDGRGNTTQFSESVIIMTSNIGSIHLAVPVINDEIREEVMDEMIDFFRPEFINRLDEVIMFNALSADNLADILKLMLKKEQKLIGERGIDLQFTSGAEKWLLEQNDEPEYGARPLRRIIRRSVREPLADFLLKANPSPGTEVRVSRSRRKDEGLKFAAIVDGVEVSVEG